MQKPNEYQKELFQEFAGPEKKPGFLKNPKFIQDRFSLTLSADKVVFVAAAFLLACIIVFCVGVERGKRIAIVRDKQVQAEGPAVVPEEPKVVAEEPAAEPVIRAQPYVPETTYAIQVATYTKASWASRMVKDLKDKGYDAYLKAGRKNHHIVYVGDYSDKKEAYSDRSKLRKRFKDCYVITLKKS